MTIAIAENVVQMHIQPTPPTTPPASLLPTLQTVQSDRYHEYYTTTEKAVYHDLSLDSQAKLPTIVARITNEIREAILKSSVRPRRDRRAGRRARASASSPTTAHQDRHLKFSTTTADTIASFAGVLHPTPISAERFSNRTRGLASTKAAQRELKLHKAVEACLEKNHTQRNARTLVMIGEEVYNWFEDWADGDESEDQVEMRWRERDIFEARRLIHRLTDSLKQRGFCVSMNSTKWFPLTVMYEVEEAEGDPMQEGSKIAVWTPEKGMDLDPFSYPPNTEAAKTFLSMFNIRGKPDTILNLLKEPEGWTGWEPHEAKEPEPSRSSPPLQATLEAKEPESPRRYSYQELMKIKEPEEEPEARGAED